MCGIVGVSLGSAEICAAPNLLEAAVHLQHRGQDACGVITGSADGTVTCHKAAGLVTSVFGRDAQVISGLRGHFGIAHDRYVTNSKSSDMQIQPISARDHGNVAIVHNGHLENSQRLHRALGLKHTSIGDTEVILHTILSHRPSIWHQSSRSETVPSWVILGLKDVYAHCIGSFACIIFIPTYGLVAFRDANGIKPIVMGERRLSEGEIDYIFASETAAFRNMGYTFLKDIRPGKQFEKKLTPELSFPIYLIVGEAIFMPSGSACTEEPRYFSRQIVPVVSYSPDIFEYVYFARAESVIDGISVNKSRKYMGETLAQTVIKEMSTKNGFSSDEIDCVIPVPETSLTCALAVAHYLRKPLAFGLVKNQFIYRTFILPSHKQRERAVSRKFSAIQEEFQGKNVLIVDDSIVRGTTATHIVRMAREAGAKKVFLGSGCPAIRFKHIYGIELADEKTLIAYGRTNLQIRKALGCDGVFFPPVEELSKACIRARCYGDVSSFEVGVFNGNYITHVS